MNIVRLFVAVSAGLLAACGGGGGGGGTGPSPSPPPVYTKALISFKTVSSVHTAPLQALQIKIALPSSVSIADLTQAVTGHNDVGQLDAGTLSYSAADRTVFMSVTGNPIKFGTFADLQCALAPTTTPSVSDFSSLNAPVFPLLEMFGITPDGTTVDLKQQIKVDMTVTFQQ